MASGFSFGIWPRATMTRSMTTSAGSVGLELAGVREAGASLADAGAAVEVRDRVGQEVP